MLNLVQSRDLQELIEMRKLMHRGKQCIAIVAVLIVVNVAAFMAGCRDTVAAPQKSLAKGQALVEVVSQHNRTAAKSNDEHVDAIQTLIPKGELSIQVGPHLTAVKSNDAIIVQGSDTLDGPVKDALKTTGDGIDNNAKLLVEANKKLDSENTKYLWLARIGSIAIVLFGVWLTIDGMQKAGIGLIATGGAGIVLCTLLQNVNPFFLTLGCIGIVGAVAITLIAKYKSNANTATIATTEVIQTTEYLKDGLAKLINTGKALGGDAAVVGAHAKLLLEDVFGHGTDKGKAHEQSPATQAIVAKTRGKTVPKIAVAREVSK